jgi:hypothetical protein
LEMSKTQVPTCPGIKYPVTGEPLTLILVYSQLLPLLQALQQLFKT